MTRKEFVNRLMDLDCGKLEIHGDKIGIYLTGVIEPLIEVHNDNDLDLSVYINKNALDDRLEVLELCIEYIKSNR